MPGPERPAVAVPPAVPQGDVPPVDHAGRRERLRERLRHLDLDAVLVTDPIGVRWCSGFTGSNGQVLLSAVGDEVLITDARYDARAETEAGDLQRILHHDAVTVALERLRLAAPDPAADAAAGAPGRGREIAASSDVVRLAFEADHLSWRQGERLRTRVTEAGGDAVPLHDEIQALRAVKDPHELSLLRRACDITCAALGWLLDDVVAPGRTEAELARRLEQRFLDLGADARAFDTIVASGPNAAVPHHAPTDRPLEAGDVLTVDCGARVGGYHADCTRTVAVGHLDGKLQVVYDVVRRAQAAGRAAAVAGATGGDVDAAARDVVADAGYGERFVHGTGHGVGLEIHEAPAIGRGAAATLRAGMTLTVEPGVYLPGTGGVRIEDTVVVTANGPAVPLTELPRTLRVL